MDWYFSHWKDEWVPSFYSFSTFCENFDKVEKSMKRSKDQGLVSAVKVVRELDPNGDGVTVEASDED
jgi:hypothetical protein